MPQELRNPERRTSEATEEVMKTLTVNNFLTNTGLKFLNISSEFIIDLIWPEITRPDAELLLGGLAFIHEAKA